MWNHDESPNTVEMVELNPMERAAALHDAPKVSSGGTDVMGQTALPSPAKPIEDACEDKSSSIVSEPISSSVTTHSTSSSNNDATAIKNSKLLKLKNSNASLATCGVVAVNSTTSTSSASTSEKQKCLSAMAVDGQEPAATIANTTRRRMVHCCDKKSKNNTTLKSTNTCDDEKIDLPPTSVTAGLMQQTTVPMHSTNSKKINSTISPAARKKT